MATTTKTGGGPAERPPFRPLSADELSALLTRHLFGTLATVKRDGTPHLTTVVYGWDPAARVARVSSTVDRLKVRHLRRDARAVLHVAGADHGAFAVVEGRAEIAATEEPGDAVGRELFDLLVPAARPDDPEAFYAEQVAEGRVVIRISADRLYGSALGAAPPSGPSDG